MFKSELMPGGRSIKSSLILVKDPLSKPQKKQFRSSSRLVSGKPAMRSRANEKKFNDPLIAKKNFKVAVSAGGGTLVAQKQH